MSCTEHIQWPISDVSDLLFENLQVDRMPANKANAPPWLRGNTLSLPSSLAPKHNGSPFPILQLAYIGPPDL